MNLANTWSVRKTTDEEKIANMPYVTSSMIEALVTCPKWGIVHSVLNKRFVTGFRQMALEAGSLMHEVFAAFNFWQVANTQGLLDHATYHGNIMFPGGRFDAFNFTTLVNSDLTQMRQLEKLAYNVIGTSEFYDDPNDKNRTLANMEHCSIELANYFLMNHTNFPIFITDKDDPTKEIGIEKSVDVVFDFYDHFQFHHKIRFIGLIDVLYQRDKNPVKLGEYKTTSSMNDGWMEAFRTRHQQTGYFAALHAYFPAVSEGIILTGSTIPVRKTTVSVQHFEIDRASIDVINFLRTAVFAKNIIVNYKQDPILAPMFTHSCNRYFRPCSLLDLCTSHHDDQEIILEQMQVAEELSPSEMKALFRQE